MQQNVAKASLRFKRMTKSMAEIQQGSFVRFALIFSDDPRLCAATFHDGVTTRRHISINQRRCMSFKPI